MTFKVSSKYGTNLIFKPQSNLVVNEKEASETKANLSSLEREIKLKEDTIKQQDTAIKQKDERIKTKDEEIKIRLNIIEMMEDIIKRKDAMIGSLLQCYIKEIKYSPHTEYGYKYPLI